MHEKTTNPPLGLHHTYDIRPFAAKYSYIGSTRQQSTLLSKVSESNVVPDVDGMNQLQTVNPDVTYLYGYCERTYLSCYSRWCHESKQHSAEHDAHQWMSLTGREMDSIGTLNAYVIHSDQKSNGRNNGREHSIDWSCDSEAFSKVVRLFLKHYVRKESMFHWLLLHSAADCHWPHASFKVVDCILWVTVKRARLGMTVNLSTWQDGSGEDMCQMRKLVTQNVKCIMHVVFRVV